MKVTLPAVYIKPTFKVDGSVKLEFETRELHGQDVAILADMRNQEGWLLFSPNELQEVDIPDEKADASTGKKTQAQRLRAVMFRYWQKKGSHGDSESHYRTEMEKVIDLYKERLEDA